MKTSSWTDLDVRRALGLALEDADEASAFSGISTDSREVVRGALFVALVGERFDGHEFVDEALSRGASGVVVSRAVHADPPARVYPVPDTLEALGALANYWRRAHSVRVVGITGSSGKTTTKELLRAALESRFRVHATVGNLNNRIGLPLTILRAPLDAEVLVLEMGTNEPGEIATLTRIATPDVGVITTVGDAHLEGLGSREGVLREKLALAEEMTSGGPVIVGDDPPELAEAARETGHPVIVAGWSDRADAEFRPVDPVADEEGRFAFGWMEERVQLKMPGRHGVSNALLVLAVAQLFEVPPDEAVRAIERVGPTGMRGEVRKIGGLTLIMDCYNANPQSVEAALDLLGLVPGRGGRVAILGSMLELGAKSEELHRDVLRSALSRPFELVVATGEFGRTDLNGAALNPEAHPSLIRAPGLAAAYDTLRSRLRGDEVILLKGSRGAAVEGLLPLFERDFGDAEAGGGD